VEAPSPALRPESAREVVDRLAAQRTGAPYVLFRDGERRQRIFVLDGASSLVHIGRGPACEIALPWDTEVSRVHGILERAGGHWTLVDDGLSRNGSFVNGHRVRGRTRLADGDELAVGRTRLLFTSAQEPALVPTDTTTEHGRPQLSQAQRRVLLALCRPLVEDPFAGPASNREIAEGLFVSIDTVKSHLQVLFDRFGVGELPQNRKRAELARRAIESGAVAH
jgi:pSer/pThr/pTyr-binding forkhead associated (FHA) protein